MARRTGLTREQRAALERIRDRGPEGWAHRQNRAGGAVARMFDRLEAAGLVTCPPYRLTDAGTDALRTPGAKEE